MISVENDLYNDPIVFSRGPEKIPALVKLLSTRLRLVFMLLEEDEEEVLDDPEEKNFLLRIVQLLEGDLGLWPPKQIEKNQMLRFDFI